jgi:adenosylmethionine-8-amino-7-oxononanoate aminotransferase
VGVIQLEQPPDREAMKAAFMDRGVWVRPFGDILYLAPALNIDDDDLGRLCEAVVAVLKTGPSRLSEERP